MTISFPNGSRSYDATRRRVRFWGYDRALEISFFVEADALMIVDPQVRDAEATVLQAFDDGRDRVHEVAASVYSRSHGFSHVLTAADF